ncbi:MULTISPECIES: HPr kinase/phosphatase C-terminal domain-containing protein [unclassified Chelatococcus]|uniref:HPr kinase/phosphorylase n=1 Tax=unclassified Chelatococcus TaxID=2638111 RepID=UPI001BCB9569|nr:MULTISPECIES: HPr kinase/phosphatase C-terminal domain-containing protein [unclassified Chelatococcus]MBS7740590.1 HPr kinase/phosphatase C-terminal domain-containing protein [Chelatococcus sp. HY11]MBX3544626.1 HPr kinase/phosphatase C-terminal domain-containing protein [Chelatococcus sp.]CAH1656818.1 putative enzyme [Hyphomicrobiales bacterium]CAH1684620.1 putative enzyme [Hyphomicrobiales bacterium]
MRPPDPSRNSNPDAEHPEAGHSGRATVHASCVVVGECGVLIRGPSGSGKSTLARRLVADARRDGRFAALVADDRVKLTPTGGRIIAEVPPRIAGMLEVRSIGIVKVAFEPACIVRLVVDCEKAYPARMPDPAAQRADICGIVLPRLSLCGSAAISPDILDFLMTQHAFSGFVDDEMMKT